MAAPPVLQPEVQSAPSPPQRKFPWIWVGIGCGAFCCCGGVILAAILFPVFAQARLAALKTSSLSNAKILGIAAVMYSGDYDDHLPSAKNWMDVTAAYKQPEMDWEKVCRSPAVFKDDPAAYGYAYRKSLSGKSMEKIEDSANTALIFDSTVLTRNAAAELDTLPNPARYGSTNTVAFTDGHAKMIPLHEPGIE